MHKAALKKPDHPKQHTGDQEPTHEKLTIQTKCEAKFTSTSKELYGVAPKLRWERDPQSSKNF